VNRFYFDLISFSPLPLQEYKQRYRSSIRVDFKLDNVIGVAPGIVFPHQNIPLNLTWDESIKVVTKGSNSILVRLPALIVDGELFILDGHHRLVDLKPRWIVLDTLHMPDNLKHMHEHLTNKGR